MSLIAGVRKAYLLILVFGVLAPRALADIAICQSGWQWALNSKFQNPCEITGALEAECQGFSSYEVGPLDEGTNYVTPQRDSPAQKCQCNTVIYSLYMACTACQNVTTQTWTFWSQYCDQVYITQYPGTVPGTTAVPHWAYLNYTVAGYFDPVTAQSAGGLPEVLAQVPLTVSLRPSSTNSSSSPVSTDPEKGPTGGSKVEGSSLTAGAIVGGVVGGLAFLAIIAVGIWVYLRRRAMKRESVYSDYPGYAASTIASEHGSQPSQMRLYNPADPSTFPAHEKYDSSKAYTTPPSNQGYYNGVAEL